MVDQIAAGSVSTMDLLEYVRNITKYNEKVSTSYHHISNEGDHCFDSGVIISRNQWTAIEINQRQEDDSYKYEVKINDVSLGSIKNEKPRKFYNVKVFGAGGWFNEAEGSMKNLVINPNLKGEILYLHFLWTGDVR